MLRLYVMHKRQEFTCSTFAFKDAFRRAVDDFGLEARCLCWQVLVLGRGGAGREQQVVSVQPCL